MHGNSPCHSPTLDNSNETCLPQHTCTENAKSGNSGISGNSVTKGTTYSRALSTRENAWVSSCVQTRVWRPCKVHRVTIVPTVLTSSRNTRCCGRAVPACDATETGAPGEIVNVWHTYNTDWVQEWWVIGCESRCLPIRDGIYWGCQNTKQYKLSNYICAEIPELNTFCAIRCEIPKYYVTSGQHQHSRSGERWYVINWNKIKIKIKNYIFNLDFYYYYIIII